MLSGEATNTNLQSLVWPNRAGSNDLTYSRRASKSLHHWCRSTFIGNFDIFPLISLNDIILLVSTKTDSDTENYQSVRRQTHCDVIDKNLTTALNFSNTLSLVWYHCSSYQTRFDILSIISANIESLKIIQARCTLYNIMW